MSFVMDLQPEAGVPPAAAKPGVVDALSVTSEPWLAGLLDQIDYGLVVLDEVGAALHANRAAREWLASSSAPLRLRCGRVEAVAPRDGALLRRALAGAASRGWRALLALGQGGEGVAATVGPLPGACATTAGGLALLVISRRHVCDNLTAQMFANQHGLTLAESQVLDLLCGGLTPREVARRQDIALSTVRTHIGSIRSKTRARSVGTLVRAIALLPPSGHAMSAAAALASS